MRNHAFSLIELSIVLVILGMLVGGILGGQSLIRAAELRSIVTEKDKYVVAVNAFRSKYNALPGDLTNATSYWTPAHATNITCLYTTRTTSSTCNGNGDGFIGDYYGLFAYSGGDMEYNLAWEQLALAGLIEGNYVGMPTLGIVQPDAINQAGVTSPAGKLSGSGWTFGSKKVAASLGNSGSYSAVWQGKYNHQLVLAGRTGAVLDRPLMPVTGMLPAAEAYSVDSKMDDGKPGTGLVRTGIWNSSANDCATSATYSDAATATYYLQAGGTNCKLMFDLGF